MRLEIKPNQEFDDWDKKAIVIINTAEFLSLSLDDAVSLMRVLGAYISPKKRMYFSYNQNIASEIYRYMEHVMKSMKVPNIYIGIQWADSETAFIALKTYAVETLPVSPANRKMISLLWYDTEGKKIGYHTREEYLNQEG